MYNDISRTPDYNHSQSMDPFKIVFLASFTFLEIQSFLEDPVKNPADEFRFKYDKQRFLNHLTMLIGVETIALAKRKRILALFTDLKSDFEYFISHIYKNEINDKSSPVGLIHENNSQTILVEKYLTQGDTSLNRLKMIIDKYANEYMRNRSYNTETLYKAKMNIIKVIKRDMGTIDLAEDEHTSVSHKTITPSPTSITQTPHYKQYTAYPQCAFYSAPAPYSYPSLPSYPSPTQQQIYRPYPGQFFSYSPAQTRAATSPYTQYPQFYIHH